MAILATIYLKQSKMSEAQELSIYVLNARKRILGEDNPDTAASMINLLALYTKQGQWEEAKSLKFDISKCRKQIFGEESQQMSKDGQLRGMSGRTTKGRGSSETQVLSGSEGLQSGNKQSHIGKGEDNRISQRTSQQVNDSQLTLQESKSRRGINITLKKMEEVFVVYPRFSY
ncbi:hypothetical protein B0J17DRAFT_674953 [Rhizoctonia solani]|nr:hypothetical protein B0J17DRAFT_674953 [Rhizoctonia solani]